MLSESKHSGCSISIALGALEAIFDECDAYNADETGGRLLGTYRQHKGRYDIEVRGVLEPGPNAQRSATYFLQDGDYQEKLFRAIEADHPEIEHLGNWHTHHVNGYRTLSDGDRATYFKTVNHEKHNTDFFYALLVVGKNPSPNPRYEVKHFLFLRGDETVYEIPAEEVRLVDEPMLRTLQSRETANVNDPRAHKLSSTPSHERAKDQEFFADFYPGFRALLAKDIGAPYWKGPLVLVDGSSAEVVAMEDCADKAGSYSIASSCKNPVIGNILAQYKQRKFRSARHAVIQLERDLNLALYRGKRDEEP